MSRLEEDAVIAELTQNSCNGFYVDIGASDGITWSNTYPLLKRGWKGIAIECDEEKTPLLVESYKALDCKIKTEKATPDNINELTAEAPADFDVLSLDIDGYDYWVLMALLKTHQPKHIVLEINQCVPPPYKFTVLFDPAYWWAVNTFYGQSLSAACELLFKHGYRLHSVVFDNAVFTLGASNPCDVEPLWKEGFLDRKDGDAFPNFGQQVCANVMNSTSHQGLRKLQTLWSDKLGEFTLWI